MEKAFRVIIERTDSVSYYIVFAENEKEAEVFFDYIPANEIVSLEVMELNRSHKFLQNKGYYITSSRKINADMNTWTKPQE